MKILVELNYPDEQIQFFADSLGKAPEKDLNEFAIEYLTELLKNTIVAPFIDSATDAKYQEAQALKATYEANAQAGIKISIE